MRKYIFTLFFIFLTASMVHAATYYVDNANGNDGNDGSTEGLAWASLSHAADQVAAGDIVYVQSGTDYTAQDGANGCVLQLTTVGTATAPITWIGYTTTITDGGVATINADTNTLANAVLTTVGFNNFKNFRFTGGSDDGFDAGTTADTFTFINCRFDNNDGHGFQGDDTANFILCSIDSNSGGGIDGDNEMMIIASKIFSNSGANAVESQGSLLVVSSIFYDNGGVSNIRASANSSIIINCVIDGDDAASSVGYEASGSASFPSAYNTIFMDLATGISATSDFGSNAHVDYNLFYSNTADRSNVAAGDNDVAGSSDPFTASATRDYTLKTSSEAEDAGLDANEF